jgi:hypothetical protein
MSAPFSFEFYETIAYFYCLHLIFIISKRIKLAFTTITAPGFILSAENRDLCARQEQNDLLKKWGGDSGFEHTL